MFSMSLRRRLRSLARACLWRRERDEACLRSFVGGCQDQSDAMEVILAIHMPPIKSFVSQSSTISLVDFVLLTVAGIPTTLHVA